MHLLLGHIFTWKIQHLLLLAIVVGEVEVVRLLVAVAPDLHQNLYQTPLHHAAGAGHVEVVRLLLESGMELGEEAGEQWTSLHIAAEAGHLEVVRLLLDRGAALEAIDDDNRHHCTLLLLGGAWKWCSFCWTVERNWKQGAVMDIPR